MFNKLRLASARYTQKSSIFGYQANRGFAKMSDECAAHISALGIKNKNIVYNPTVAECYEYAMLPEHMWSPDDTVGPNSITETGALCISSGSKTGRVPK